MPCLKNEAMTSTRINAARGFSVMRISRRPELAPLPRDGRKGQRQHHDEVRQHLDELRWKAFSLQTDLRGVEEAEKQRRRGGRPRPVAAEIESGERDEAASSRDALAEETDDANRQLRAAQPGEEAGDNRGNVADRQRPQAQRMDGGFSGAGGAQAQAC